MNYDKEDFSSHPWLVQGFILIGVYIAPAVLPLSIAHIVLRYFYDLAPRGDWLLALIYSSGCCLYMAIRYGAFWR